MLRFCAGDGSDCSYSTSLAAPPLLPSLHLRAYVGLPGAFDEVLPVDIFLSGV